MNPLKTGDRKGYGAQYDTTKLSNKSQERLMVKECLSPNSKDNNVIGIVLWFGSPEMVVVDMFLTGRFGGNAGASGLFTNTV